MSSEPLQRSRKQQTDGLVNWVPDWSIDWWTVSPWLAQTHTVHSQHSSTLQLRTKAIFQTYKSVLKFPVGACSSATVQEAFRVITKRIMRTKNFWHCWAYYVRWLWMQDRGARCSLLPWHNSKLFHVSNAALIRTPAPPRRPPFSLSVFPLQPITVHFLFQNLVFSSISLRISFRFSTHERTDTVTQQPSFCFR